ncbi:MAG: hypothetical protein ABIH23_24680 [bacterium]
MRVECQAYFKLKKDVFESMLGSDPDENDYEFELAPMVFESQEIMAINQRSDGNTSVWFKTGDGIGINCRYEEFREMYFPPERILK